MEREAARSRLRLRRRLEEPRGGCELKGKRSKRVLLCHLALSLSLFPFVVLLRRETSPKLGTRARAAVNSIDRAVPRFPRR